ncbi:MAG: hypothetical protein ACLTZI_16225 [[Eubacterium] siraeum]
MEQPHIPARIDAAQINNSAFFIGLSFLPLLSADVEEYRTGVDCIVKNSAHDGMI